MSLLLVACLLLVALLLLAVIYSQYRSKALRTRQISLVAHNLARIIDADSKERLLLFTDDEPLKTLLVEANRLLDRNQKLQAHFAATELATRKMISNISHDLRTPLTVILGYLETIQLDPAIDPAERARLLTKVQAKAGEVLTLMNKFFDLARLESEDASIPLTTVLLNEACSRNMLQFYESLTAKGFEVTIRIPEQPIYALGNEDALDRILNNLISNAIRHGGDGKVVGLTLEREDEYARIDVWDEGKGIGEQHKDRVFERMYTLDDARNHAFQGSGLGLTITKRLVERLGGTIHLYSNPNIKTIFSIRFKTAELKKLVRNG
ncbi:MAG: sensor histidine kinase [Cohnella sp.]|nr:sensor histidine kinase [Cohnella sp.]